MPPTKKPETPELGMKPASKKVKIVNRGSEIKQMRIIAEAARKPTIPPDLNRDAVPDSASKQGEITQVNTANIARKASKEKTPAPNDVAIKTKAANSHSGAKLLSVEKQDELDIFPREPDTLGSKKVTNKKEDDQRKKEQRRNDALSGKTRVTQKYSIGPKALVSGCLVRKIRALGQRIREVERARDDLELLEKNDEAMEMAAVLLQWQIHDYQSDLDRLWEYERSWQTRGSKESNLKTLVVRALVGLYSQQSSVNKIYRKAEAVPEAIAGAIADAVTTMDERIIGLEIFPNEDKRQTIQTELDDDDDDHLELESPSNAPIARSPQVTMKKGAAVNQSKKRKREDIEDTPNKKVISGAK